MIAQVLTAHMPVYSGSPVPSIPRASAVVDIHHCISSIGKKVVKHEFPEIAAPPFMGILQIPGAMHENDTRLACSRRRGPVHSCIHPSAIGSGKRNDFGVSPLV